jgi:type VI secretion system protein ImpA
MQKRVEAYVPAVSVLATGETAPQSLSAENTLSRLDPGELHSREDVVRQLNRICEYYTRVEPSSPVPLILKRAVRLAEMDFVQIIKDLAPEAIAEIYRISGDKEA